MTPTSIAAPPRSPAPDRQAAYPFAAFALQATLGVRLPSPASPERGGAA